MARIFVPSAGPADWKALLADPENQWARGFSARSLAHAWEDSDGLPPEIATVLRQTPSLRGFNPLFIFPEWKVPLPGGSAPSQNDVWVLGTCDAGLVSISIEGKVNESFDENVGKWKANASEGKLKRLTYLAAVLGIEEPIPDTIYYQLLHRTASAVIEAERLGATQAAMLVHSFSPTNRWFEEFSAFVALFNATAALGELSSVTARGGIPLHLAWIHGDERFLDA